MSNHKIILNERPAFIKAHELNIGDYAILNYPSDNSIHDKIIIKTFGEIVLLDDPATTWAHDLSYNCTKLLKGSNITIIIGDSDDY